MKKLSKILLTFAFVLMLAVPFALIGCGEKIIPEEEQEVPGEVYDVEVGAFYYCEVTQQDGFPENRFLVVRFVSKTQFTMNTVAEEQYIVDSQVYNPYSCIGQEIDGRYVYTCVFDPDGTGTTVYSYVVTALGNNQVQFTASSSDGSQNLDKVLTKYVAA